LASASVWTRRAGGNDAVSLIVTVVTNLSCFVVTPFWLWLTTGNRITSEELSFADLGRSLAMLVVLPMVVAQVIRLLPRVAQWSSRQKIALNTLAQCGVLFMVFLGSIQMGFTISQQGDGSWGIAVATTVLAVTAIHVGGFFAGWQLAKLFRLTREDRIAVGFAGSQKTLMVGLRVSMELGVSILPMVAYHISQLIADTILADYLIARTPAAQQRDDADRLTVEQVRVQQTP
jgi:sodium/bile acid cotransporter 7